jgi:O-antigen/teichoic acid export membrane protein
MSDIKKLINNFKSAIFGNLMGQALAFFIVIYVGQTLSPEYYGIYNFIQSYTMYYFMFADLGLSLLAVREINQNENKEEIASKIFNLRLMLGLISLVIYYISLPLVHTSNLMALILYGPAVLFTSLSLDYLFISYSEMKYVGRATFIKNATILLFSYFLVRDSKSVVVLSAIYSLATFAVFFYMYITFKKKHFLLKIKLVTRQDLDLIKKGLPLAISLFMVQINNNFDVVYLSFVKSNTEVGYYSAAYKIVNFLVAVLCVYFNASYPTIAELYKKNIKELGKFMSKFYDLGMLLVIPITVGGFAVAGKIIPFLFGSEYGSSVLLFKMLIVLLFIRMANSAFGAILMLGNNNKSYSFGLIMGASINVLLNIILIPFLSTKGSAIATLVAETIQGVYFYYYYTRECSLPNVITSILKYGVCSLVMAFVINYFDFNLVLSILLGAVVYFGLVLLLKLATKKEKVGEV